MGRAVAVVGDGADVAVDIGVEVCAALAVVDAAGDHVPQVRDDAGGDEDLPLRVVVDPPGVAEPVGDDFEAILGRVVAPDTAVDVDRGPSNSSCWGNSSLCLNRRPAPFGLPTFDGVA